MNILFLFVFFAVSLCAHAVEETIFDAIKEDDDGVDTIRALVEKDPAVLESIYDWVEPGQPGITIYRSGQTPLLYAVLHGKPHAVKTLFDLGANVFATEEDGYNVLHVAGVQGRAEILELLLDHFSKKSIDMNVTTDQHADGYYPLHRACWGHESRHAETVRVMFDKGVPFDLPSRNGKTCVQLTKNRETLLAIQDAAKAMLAANSEGEL